jgi:hypothetical protein
MLLFLSMFAWGMASHAQTITWLNLPWPIDQNWGGPRGSAATTNGNVITLTGQDVLSTQSFSPPTVISYIVTLTSETTSDGDFQFFFVPTGVASNALPNPDVELQMGFNPGNLIVQTNHNEGIVFSSPFTVNAPAVFSNVVTVAANGVVSWTINGQEIALGNSVVMPYSSFQIRLSSWQPTQLWRVSDFVVGTSSTPSTCPNLVGTWSGQMNVADARKGFSNTLLSMHVTDQTTNGCLIRGFLTTGNANNNFSNIRFGWNPWFRVPFTGTIPDASTVLLNVGGDGSGKASAILDMGQTPPVLTKFVYQPNNGDTLTGDLTLQPSAP